VEASDLTNPQRAPTTAKALAILVISRVYDHCTPSNHLTGMFDFWFGMSQECNVPARIIMAREKGRGMTCNTTCAESKGARTIIDPLEAFHS
jgi:hypothetical protein